MASSRVWVQTAPFIELFSNLIERIWNYFLRIKRCTQSRSLPWGTNLIKLLPVPKCPENEENQWGTILAKTLSVPKAAIHGEQFLKMPYLCLKQLHKQPWSQGCPSFITLMKVMTVMTMFLISCKIYLWDFAHLREISRSCMTFRARKCAI